MWELGPRGALRGAGVANEWSDHSVGELHFCIQDSEEDIPPQVMMQPYWALGLLSGEHCRLVHSCASHTVGGMYLWSNSMSCVYGMPYTLQSALVYLYLIRVGTSAKVDSLWG